MVQNWVLSIFRKEIFMNLSNTLFKKISSAKLKLIFTIISKFYKLYHRFVTSSIDYVNGLECRFLWNIWNKINVNLCYLIMTRMIQARDNKIVP